jgi:uroporphyrinogen-III synthase
MKPLRGVRVLVTRAREQSPGLCARLAETGAEVVLFPTIEIRVLDDLSALDRAIDRLSDYSWIGFTSVNAVCGFWDRLQRHGVRTLPGGCRVAAVGEVTAAALAERGTTVDYVPAQYLGHRLTEGMGDLAGKRVLLPRATGGREGLVLQLQERGAEVDDIPIYRTVPVQPPPEAWAELGRGVDIATFTSGSTARHFAALTGGDPQAVLGNAIIACIGPETAAVATAVGLRVGVVPSRHTTEALVLALIEHRDGLEGAR